jgi:Xaa-Pro dipeptidase
MQAFDQNLSKVQAILEDRKIDLLLCTLGQNFRYISGFNEHISERITVALISPSDPLTIVLPSFEKGTLMHFSSIQEDQLIGWEEIEDPFEILAKTIENLHIKHNSIAISPQMPYTFFSRIQEKLPSVQFHDGLSIFEEARISKTEYEIEQLMKASALSAKGIEAALAILKEGISELEVAKFIKDFFNEHANGEPTFEIVQFGENSANPHAMPTNRQLKTGDVVIIDAGTSINGYSGDITCTTFFGNPTDEFLKIYAVVAEANQKAVEMGKVGKTGKDVDAAARNVIEKSGYGKYFIHRTGHGLGLDTHESPYMVGTNEKPLKLNTTFTVEPGIYIPGKFGVRIEDDVIAQESTGKRLSNPIRRFWE